MTKQPEPPPGGLESREVEPDTGTINPQQSSVPSRYQSGYRLTASPEGESAEEAGLEAFLKLVSSVEEPTLITTERKAGGDEILPHNRSIRRLELELAVLGIFTHRLSSSCHVPFIRTRKGRIIISWRKGSGYLLRTPNGKGYLEIGHEPRLAGACIQLAVEQTSQPGDMLDIFEMVIALRRLHLIQDLISAS